MATERTRRRSAEMVAAWLERLEGVTRAMPVEVSIYRRTWIGAEYWQTRELTPGTRAYREGEREWEMHALYLLGDIPPARAWRSSVTFTREDGSEWYLASYYAQVKGRGIHLQDIGRNEWHPFGRMFQLMPATEPENIYAPPAGYKRVPMRVQWCATVARALKDMAR